MDKPLSMSVKEYIMRKQSIRTNIPLKTIEIVIDNQFKSAYEAVKTNSNVSIEISGFGKFIYNPKKALKKVEKQRSKILVCEKQLSTDLSEIQRTSWENRKQNCLKVINQIMPKIKDDQIIGISSLNTKGTT